MEGLRVHSERTSCHVQRRALHGGHLIFAGRKAKHMVIDEEKEEASSKDVNIQSGQQLLSATTGSVWRSGKMREAHGIPFSVYSANTSNYESPSAWYFNYSADFCNENNIAHPLVRGVHDDVAQSISDFESKLDDKIDSLEKLVTQLTTNRRSTSPSASVARLCAICLSNNHYTDACPSLQHPVASDAPQAYSTNIYNRLQKQQQQHMQFYDAPFQITPQPSTSEPTLKELLEQMTMQNLKFKQESMKIQQETQAAMQNLSNQIRQMVTLAPEENAEVFEDQARISSTMEPGYKSK
ncbi:uncharacterized protein LOC128195811 [Vigna angularis]|uniref:uncharacterized protein LOC128195811 n=1 Tax=Phaseolus angularis TaxID=3914 RepID=UPI0022B382C9|nr:uncharacterized protein LOC128195811 [Vigna angularis]